MHYYYMMEQLQTWFGLVIRFIEHLQTVAIYNYSSIASSYTLHFAKALTKSYQSAVLSPVSSASLLTFITNSLLF
jgi:hypothetical protein